MIHTEVHSHERAFDYFRGKVGVNVDWVKLQVYGKDCIPEEFPDEVKTLSMVLDSIRELQERRVQQGKY